MQKQSHSYLGTAKWDMAQALRNRYIGKTMPDEIKVAVKHLEEMAKDDWRRAEILPQHDEFTPYQ